MKKGRGVATAPVNHGERITIRQLARLSGVSIGTVSRALNGYTDVSPETLYSAGLIGKPEGPVKLLGTGDADRSYTVRGVSLSASARAKIEAAGGKIEG